VYGCGNDRFGGCGSVLQVSGSPALGGDAAANHNPAAVSPSDLPALQGVSFPCIRGVLAAEAVEVLKRFYARGNQNIPLERRHRKGVAAAAATQAQVAASAEQLSSASAADADVSASPAKRAKV